MPLSGILGKLSSGLLQSGQLPSLLQQRAGGPNISSVLQMLHSHGAQPMSPMVNPQAPPVGGPMVNPQAPMGGLAGFGGQPNVGPGMPGMALPDVGNANVATLGTGRTINPQIAQIAMSLMQRSQRPPMQFNPMQMFRGGR